MEEVIYCSHLVVLVRIQTLLCLLLLESVLLKHLHNGQLYRNLVLANYQSKSPNYWLVISGVPRMLHYLLGRVPGFRIFIQNLLQKVLAVRRYPFWNLELPIQYFLVKNVRILVFEGKESTHHRIEDDSATPNVNSRPMIVMASDHLRSSIAGRPTSSLKSFSFSISVT